MIKQSSDIHSPGLCIDGDVPETLQSVLQETQDLRMPGTTGSRSEVCCQKEGNERRISTQNAPPPPPSHLG